MSDVLIDISNNQTSVPVDQAALQSTVEHVLAASGVGRGSASVAVVDDETIRQLKRKYFGQDAATDVISFDLRDDAAEPDLDCEVVISAERAQAVAAQRGGDVRAELHLYVVHGLLHQLGYDDQQADSAQRMHDREDTLLRELGFGAVFSGKE